MSSKIQKMISGVLYAILVVVLAAAVILIFPVYRKTKTSGQFSFEERMGCGFGACMGCSCQTKHGSKRICREGPVLRTEEIIW